MTKQEGIKLVIRPYSVLANLPPTYKWEFTRRHPYYLRCWKDARDFYQNPAADEIKRDWQKLCRDTLWSISCPAGSGDAYLSPDVEAREQGIETPFVNLSAVTPLTYRTLAMLLAELPEETRRKLAFALSMKADSDDDKLRQLMHLEEIKDTSLNEIVQRPILGIDPNAPIRAIREAVETVAKRWKAPDAKETRRRDDQLDLYLAVWDQREGFSEGCYDGSREKRLKDISIAEKIPRSTAASRHKSAFRLIVGHEYDPILWIDLFGAKLHPSKWSSWRIEKSKGKKIKTTTETDLGLRLGGFTSTNANEAILVFDVMEDVRTLLEKGKQSDAIADELDIPKDVVEYFANRYEDGL